MKYKEYVYLIILLFLASLNFNIFLKQFNLVVGGTQGLSIIIHKFIPISHSIIILIINIIMLLLSIILMSKKMTLGTIISTFLYPLFVNLTSILILKDLNIIISIIISGIISGITNGLIYKLGFSTGGIGLLPPIINKFFNIKIGSIQFIINFIIIVFNIILFGLNNFIYSLLVIVINGIIINLIIDNKIL